MGILRSGGALDHYTTLREELGRYEADVEMLRQRLDTAERLANTKTELDMERTRLVKALRDDIHEREGIVREVILSFEELSQSLYERAGSLTISDTPNGLQFDVHIAAERSKGITNMQIFCFDLMLTEIYRYSARAMARVSYPRQSPSMKPDYRRNGDRRVVWLQVRLKQSPRCRPTTPQGRMPP